MGVLDSLGRLIGGSGKNPLPLDLEPGEQELLRVSASGRPGRLNSVGGELVLTTHRCAFCPFNTKDVVEVLSWGLGKAGAPVGGKIAKALGDQVDSGASEHGLGGIVEVRTGTDASLSKPPTLILVGADGSSAEIGILAGRLKPNASHTNEDARDAAVAAIATQIARVQEHSA